MECLENEKLVEVARAEQRPRPKELMFRVNSLKPISAWIATGAILSVTVMSVKMAFASEVKTMKSGIDLRTSKPDHTAVKLSCDRLFADPPDQKVSQAALTAVGSTDSSSDPFDELPPQLKGSFYALEQLRRKHERLPPKDAFEMTQADIETEIRRLQNRARSRSSDYSSRQGSTLTLSDSAIKRLETLKGAKEALGQCRGELFEKHNKPVSDQNDDL